MNKPTGKLAFAYRTIANMELKIKQLEQDRNTLTAHNEILNDLVGEVAKHYTEDCLVTTGLKDVVRKASESHCNSPVNTVVKIIRGEIADHNERLIKCLTFKATHGGLKYDVVCSKDIADNCIELRK